MSLAEKERKRTNIKNSMHSLVAAERAEKYRAAALQLTEALTRMGSNYWDLKSDYAYLKDLADALEKAGESDHAAEVLDKAALGFRSFEEAVSDSWKWNVSWDIARIRYDEGNVLFNLGRWDDAVAVFGNGLKEIDGAEQYRIQMEIDDADLELGAIYHSHTRTDPYPSQTDINLAFYPDALYLIVGVADPQAPQLRGYSIRDGQVSDAELVVE